MGKKIANYTVRHHPAQINIVENPGERPHLVYTEGQSKKLIDLEESGAEAETQKSTPSCKFGATKLLFVRLFKLYSNLCPKDRAADSLYLQPLPKPRADCWYSKQPYGHNCLTETVAHLRMQNAGILGYITQIILLELQCNLAF